MAVATEWASDGELRVRIVFALLCNLCVADGLFVSTSFSNVSVFTLTSKKKVNSNTAAASGRYSQQRLDDVDSGSTPDIG